jgi:hypothetical protein
MVGTRAAARISRAKLLRIEVARIAAALAAGLSAPISTSALKGA